MMSEPELREAYYYLLLDFFERIDSAGHFCHWLELVRRIEAGDLLVPEA